MSLGPGARVGVWPSALAGVVAAGVLLAGCSGTSEASSDAAWSSPPSAAASSSADSPSLGAGQGELTVLAGASLKATFTALGMMFQADHPGTSVRFNFGGSADLVSQLEQGAPGDVLATADTATMARAAADGLLTGSARPFARNSMMIAVPLGNPARISAFADLAKPGVEVVVCAAQVPCGAAAKRVETNTGVTLSPVSQEGSVTDVLGKVASGEADAGVVYVTDVKGSGSVAGVAIASNVNATNTYPIAILAGGNNRTLAGRFRDFVLDEKGQEVLADAGFGAP